MTIFLEHAPFLLLVLSLIGMALVWVGSWSGAEVARWSARTNIGLSLLLAVGMVLHYDVSSPRGPRVQMTTSIAWLSSVSPVQDGSSEARELLGPQARLAWGVDGLTLWLVALVPFLICLALEEVSDDPLRMVGLLGAGAAAISCFAARDLLLLLVSCGGLTVALSFAIGLGCHCPTQRRAAGRFLIWHATSDFALMLFVAGLTVATAQMVSLGKQDAWIAPPFLIDLIIPGIGHLTQQPGTRDIWMESHNFLLATLLLAILFRCAMFPVHHAVWNRFAAGPDRLRGLAMLLPSLVGMSLALRLLVPLFPLVSTGPINVLGLIGLLTVLLSTVGSNSSTRETMPTRMLSWGGGIILIGLATRTPEGITGSLLLSLGWFSSLALATSRSSRLFLESSSRDSSGSGKASKGISAFAFGGLTLLPGLAGFPGAWLILLGLSKAPGTIPGGILLGIPLLLICLGMMGAALFRLHRSSARNSTGGTVPSPPVSPTEEPLSDSSLVYAVPLLLALLGMGWYPQAMTKAAVPVVNSWLQTPPPSPSDEK